MSKIVRNIAITMVAVAAGIFLLSKTDFFSRLKNPFAEQQVLIDDTPILIREINALAKLMTITYTDEVVKDTAKPGNGLPSLAPLGAGAILRPSMDRLVIIGRGKVIAGTDLKKLDSTDFMKRGDTLQIRIPHAQILETILNPSDFEIFDMKGDWNESEITCLKVNVRNEINRRATSQGILKSADDRSRMILEGFLKNTGYPYVQIRFD